APPARPAKPGATAEPAWETRLHSAPPVAAAPRAAGRASARASAPTRVHDARVPSRESGASRTAEPPVVTSRNEPDRIGTGPEPAERPGESADANPRRRDEPVERVSIPAGTQLSLVLDTPLSSAVSHPGARGQAGVWRG